MSQLRKSTLATALAGLLFAAAATAQNDAGGWRHTFVLYGMGAAIEGTAGLRDFEVPVELSISDVFESLEMGAMAAYRGENDTWSVTVDTTFMGLGATTRSQGGRVKGDVDLDQTTVMGTVGRKLSDRVEVLAGFAWFDLSTKLVLDGPLATREAEADADWIDPTLGLAWHHPFGNRWRADLRTDVGGFGLGSDLLVHVLATCRWQASDRVGVGFGYRFIQFDYEEGRGDSFQSYDLTEQGPLAGITFSF
jgi:hypothetical protein